MAATVVRAIHRIHLNLVNSNGMSQPTQRKNTRSRHKQNDSLNNSSELKTRAEQRLESATKERAMHRTPQTRPLRSEPVSQMMSQYMSQMQDDQQQDRQDLFTITEEEQKRMKAMLELFRKGVPVHVIQKITKENAFEIPLKVIDGESMSTNNLNIWRMASDMLSVSSNIYDKRVENTHDDSTKLHSLLAHKEQQQSMLKSSAKKQQRNPFDPKALQDFKLGKGSGGSVTLEQEDKINCSLNDVCQTDLMFHRARRVFDTSSTSGLLLNTFTISDQLSINMTESSKELQQPKLMFDFSEVTADISSSNCYIFGLFKKAQAELIEMFQDFDAPLPEQPQFKLAPENQEEASRLAELIVLSEPIFESVEQISPFSQPVPEYPEEILSTKEVYRSQSANSDGMNDSRAESIHMEYDQLSMRSQDIGSGDQDFLEKYNSPWDIPNYFKKKRNISKVKGNRDKEPKKRQSKDIWPKFDQRILIDRGFLKAKTTKSKSKAGKTLDELDDIENLHLNTQTPDNFFFVDRGVYKQLRIRPILVDKRSNRESEIPVADHPQPQPVEIYDEPYQLEVRAESTQPSQPFKIPVIQEQHQQPRLNVFSVEPTQQNQKHISMKQYKNRLYRQIIEGIGQLSSLRKEESISVQATFVALLHLANQKSLSLEGNSRGDNFSIRPNKKMETE